MLSLRQGLALLAEVPVEQYIERVGVVRSVDDPEVLTAGHLDAGLESPFGCLP